jgi:heptosyltransferase-2
MNYKKSIFDFNNFLIINTAFIGDVALSVYLANEIKIKHPNSNISFLTTPNSSSLLKPIKAIDSIFIYNKNNEGKSLSSIKTKADMLSKLSINCIINPHQSFRTSLLTHYIKSDYKIGYKSASLNFVYNYKIEYKKNRHSIFRNLELLKGFKEFDNISEYSKVELSFNETDLELVDNILLQNGVSDLNRVVAIAPTSAWKTKEWIESHFIDLCKKLKEKKYEVVLIGSKSDFEKCQRISDETFSSNLTGKLDLDQTLILLSNSKLLISNDSSPVHLAGIVNTPTIEIFGPTSPIFGFGPSSDKFKIIENNKLKCRPCNIHGENICPLGTHECMTSLSPDDIMKEIENII